MAGLLFASESEAASFRAEVEKTLRMRKEKREGKWMKC